MAVAAVAVLGHSAGGGLHVGDTTIPRLTCMQALSVAEQVD